MPIAGFRYALSEISSGSFLEPFSRYAVSFAGDPSKRNISNLQLAPYLNLGLPDHWFVAFYPSPDIRVNFGDPVTGQTGRLFLPFDARIGRNLTDHIALSLEVGVPIIKDYPVYNVKAEVRLNVSYLLRRYTRLPAKSPNGMVRRAATRRSALAKGVERQREDLSHRVNRWWRNDA